MDWANIHSYVADGVYTPYKLQDLVVIVQEIEARNAKGKAVGSLFSLSQAPDSDNYIIDTATFLTKHVSSPFPRAQGNLESARFRHPGHDERWLATVPQSVLPAKERVLIHVEAGIRIHDLLADLASIGLSLPTMGSGGGQRLAGALATATHGSDINLPPLGDAVKAIHLVGPDGQEWWLEGNGGWGGGGQYERLPGWCPDTKVVRDTDFLNTVVAGIGRFGIIYSMIVEVELQYRLEEHRYEATWSSVRSRLRQSLITSYAAPGSVFDDPLRGEPLRFWMCVIDGAGGTRAWITRRWITSNLNDEGIDKGADIFGYLCNNDETTTTIIFAVTTVATNALTLAGSAAAAIPLVGWYFALQYYGLAADILAAYFSYTTVGEYVAKVIDAAKSWDIDFGLGVVDSLLRDLMGAILDNEHQPPLRRGPSHLILDTHNYDIDGCFSVDSVEFFFNAESESYLHFIDDVLKAAQELGPLMSSIGLRFVRKTASLLGMERFSLTAAVEVGNMRPGSENARFAAIIRERARAHGGIPHWGQQHTLNNQQVEGIYGDNLERWRWVLAETEAEIRGTFSSNFTRSRGLEPTKPLDAYRAERYVAAIVSGM